MKHIAALIMMLFASQVFADFSQTPAHGFHWYSKEERILKPKVVVKAPPVPQLSPYEKILKMRKATLDKLSQALIEPSFEATHEYMKAQQVYAKKNQAFVRYWQQVLMTHPELDHTLNFPTDNAAIAIRNDSRNELTERVIQESAKKYGLILFYRGESVVSQKMISHLLPFVTSNHFSMISVTTDGQSIQGLPNPKNIPLKAVQNMLDIQERYMPALYLVNLETKKMSPLSFGFVSLTELKERFLDVATNFKRFSYEGIAE